METPVFQQAVEKRQVLRAPVLEAIKRHPREFFVVVGARLAENGLGYLFPVFTLSYLTKNLGLPKNMVLIGLVVASFAQIFGVLGASILSDKIGRRPVYIGAAIFCALFAFPFFMLVNTQSTPLIYLALILAIAIGVGGMFGPQAAYFAELFGPRIRYSGFAFARELGSILAGGPAPFIATWLLIQGGGTPWLVAIYIIVLSVITAIAVYFGPETYKSDITEERMK